MWPTLADQHGLLCTPVEAAAHFDRLTGAVGVVSGGGTEEKLEEAVRQATGGGRDAIEIAAVGARADHHLAVALVRAGAANYFALPEDITLLGSWLRERAEQLRAETRRLEFVAVESSKFRFEGVLGESAALKAALDRAARVIPHGSVTVLLTGETGTGKELVLRAIHYNGPRRGAPFVDINCEAIPEQLLESELFGHEKGAFTGATVAKPGLFELANGGTLFLDEVGHLPLVLQGKLLRALEERSMRRVGGTRSITIDVRVIAATHVELAAAVARREFREDLFHRLNVVPIELPALRARREDIPMLARHFLTRFGRRVPTAGSGTLARGRTGTRTARMERQHSRTAQSHGADAAAHAEARAQRSRFHGRDDGSRHRAGHSISRDDRDDDARRRADDGGAL
jgi:DNA-binding NtrC family response regulator